VGKAVLAETLSALRQLILDDIELPPEHAARRALYGSLFPKLDGETLDDLARMEPQRLGVYTRSIFSGERGLLTSHFPLTVAVLQRFAEETTGKKLDLYEFVRGLHSRFPWNGNSTDSFAKNFAADTAERFFRGEVPLEARECSRFELARLRAARSEDSPLFQFPKPDPEAISRLTVDELLDTKAGVPSGVRFELFEIDAAALYDEFREAEKTLPAGPIERHDTAIVISRSRSFSLFATALSRPVYDFLSRVPADELFALEELAEAFAGEEAAADENRLFREFFQLVALLESRGAIVLKP
jgi:hypothetical protein